MPGRLYLGLFAGVPLLARPPRQQLVGDGGVEDVQHTLAGLVPGLRPELHAVGDDQVLQAVGTGAGQLLVVCRGERRQPKRGQTQQHKVRYRHRNRGEEYVWCDQRRI